MIACRLLVPLLLAASLGIAAPAVPSPEAAALAVLSSSSDLHDKARACQELGVFGSRASVAPLAALLDHEQLSDYARSGLEGIQDPAAGEALRQALPRLEGRRLAGVVNSLGVRREKSAVRDLGELAHNDRRGVANEAIASLGMIGTAEAAEVLQHVLANGPIGQRTNAAHAALVAADHLARQGNATAARDLLHSVVRALPPGDIATVAQNRAATLPAGRKR